MSKLISNSFFFLVTLFSILLLINSKVFAQDKMKDGITDITTTNVSLASLKIPNSTSTVLIDGELDDPIWNNALVVPLDIVNSPWNNLPSPIKTEAKLIENGEFLYVAFIAHDPNPEKIQGFLGDRDTKWFDDIVGIKLDTHNNRRLNYEFFVNPFGVQNDAIFNEITGEANDLWDGIWHSYGKITAEGYQVEIAIPYNILNFEENGEIKQWAIELVRSYPRETRLRISHIPLDRDNPCWLCQYPEAVGFEKAETGNNVRLTPAITATRAQSKDIYKPKSDWNSKNDIEAGIDLRWGIDANTSLNATLNPDFSNVEADAGQLSINTTFSLFYDEKRSFFLDNSDYFDSNYDLVYTRNIVAPDYGAKLTGRTQKHSYGVFVTNDTETNFFLPGNLGSDVASLNQESHSAAIRYRYDYDDNLSIGTVSTLRKSTDYHNYVAGFDARYRITDSNIIKAQLLTSLTEYPDDLFKSFCFGKDCEESKKGDCSLIDFGNCEYNEQANRSNIQGEFNDQAIKVDFLHDSEYWKVELSHDNIGADFRADLGYQPKVDKKENSAEVTRLFYGDQSTLWQKARLSSAWNRITNSNNEFIERAIDAEFSIDGPRQSELFFTLTHAEKVGLRHNDEILAIDGNTTRFTEDQLNIFSRVKMTPRLYMSLDMTLGDKIDYKNNRLGDIKEISANLTWNITNHLELDITHTFSELNADNPNISAEGDDNVYTAHLSNLLLSYQFDVQSYLKLTITYSDIDRNINNNPFVNVSAKNTDLATQLIYAYKLNPQTVFFLGYSDTTYQDDYLDDLSRAERAFFSKISYSWMP
jgi:hypothetical protein